MTNGCIGITVIQNVNVIELEKIMVFPIQIGFSNTNWFFQLSVTEIIGFSRTYWKFHWFSQRSPENYKSSGDRNSSSVDSDLRITLYKRVCERPNVVSLYFDVLTHFI